MYVRLRIGSIGIAEEDARSKLPWTAMSLSQQQRSQRARQLGTGAEDEE